MRVAGNPGNTSQHAMPPGALCALHVSLSCEELQVGRKSVLIGTRGPFLIGSRACHSTVH
jgi:hypothetical protein